MLKKEESKMVKIEVKHVTKKFKEQQVLQDINLELEQGNIYGLTGRNGSGKTVLLKIMCGLVQPDQGEVIINEHKLDGKTFPQNMGIIIENPGFITWWSGYRNLEYLSSFNRIIKKEQIIEVMKDVGLLEAKDKKVGKYSLGMKQRLGIAQAIMENPDILILDEPFNGLDKEGVNHIYNLLKEFKQQGKLIFLVSHIKEDIEMVCDVTFKLEDGKVKKINL